MEPIYTNKEDWDEKFYFFNYKILVTAQGIEFRVNADSEQTAIDEIINYCEENGLSGLIASYSELIENGYTDKEIEEFICGGNHGLYLTTHNIYIEEEN